MQQLILLIYRFRATLIFILFELLCVYLIIENNAYQGASFINSSNVVAANILKISNNVGDYFSLQNVNEQLAEENAALRAQLQQGNVTVVFGDSLITEDTLRSIDYSFTMAEVISNSIRRMTNYITINKGTADGIERGMGVIGPEGVVGNVKAVSRNYAVVNSLLHTNMQISAKVQRTQDLGTVTWEGIDFTKASLRYIPRHVELLVGDTIVTSGFNTVFPPDILIGVIDNIEEREEEQFYEVDIDLAVDFNELGYVYIIRNEMKQEIDSLQTETIEWLQQE